MHFKSFISQFYKISSYIIEQCILYIKIEQQHQLLEYLNDFRLFNYSVCILNYLMFIDGHRFGIVHSHLIKLKIFSNLEAWGIFWSLFLFLMLIGDKNHFTKCLNQSKLLKSFGDYSYGVYLINITALYINREKVFGPSFNGILFITVFCYWFAFLFHHLVEKNMIRLANLIISKLESSIYYQLLPLQN